MLSIREHRFPFLVKVGDWNRFNANTGGTMVEKCCHFFDLMRVIVGAEPVRVFCSGGVDVNHAEERYDGRTPDIIDNSFTTVDFANGVRALLDLSMFADGAENQEEIVAVGDAARLDVLIPAGEIVFHPRVGFRNPKRVERSHVAVDPQALAAGQHHGATFYQHAAFAAAVRGEGPVQVTADDGLRAVAMGLAAETSAREHRVVEMSGDGVVVTTSHSGARQHPRLRQTRSRPPRSNVGAGVRQHDPPVVGKCDTLATHRPQPRLSRHSELLS